MSSRPGMELAVLALVGVPAVLNLVGLATGVEGLRRAAAWSAAPLLLFIAVSIGVALVQRRRDGRDVERKERLVEQELEMVAAGATLACARIDGTRFEARCEQGRWLVFEGGASHEVVRAELARELVVYGSEISLRRPKG